VAVPYSFDTTPWANIPAVTTARYVFWVTNPSLAMYFAMNQHCKGVSAGTLAFEAESSYSSIQVWRMDPYEFCPTDPKTGVRRCPEDASATFRTLPGFISGTGSMSKVCQQYFLVVAPTITYVNDHNLALTVLNTTFVNVDIQTLRPINESKARLVIQLPRLEIHLNPGRSEGLPLLVLHLKVREDAIVQLVQHVHPVRSAASKRAQMAHTLEEPRLVALVRAGDPQHLVLVFRRKPMNQHTQLLRIPRQAMHDRRDLIRAQHARALQLQGQRFVRIARHVAHRDALRRHPVLLSSFFFLCFGGCFFISFFIGF
jgi:hypothetical protein